MNAWNDGKPVMKDVARLAGVSTGTVSRYLNGSPKVSPDARRRVEAAIRELGYRPNASARTLKTDRSNSLVVFTTETTLYGASRMLQGIERAATEAGYLTSIVSLQADRPGDGRRAAELVNAQSPAGVLFISVDQAIRAAYDMIPTSTPRVLVGQRWSDRDAQVSVCETQGGHLIARHLLALGHRTVHHVGVPDAHHRADGWRSALKEAGAPVPEPIMTSWYPSDAVGIGARLALTDGVTAVFAANDEIAMGLIAGIRRTGKRVPEDVSVVGFDDHPLSPVCQPPLTTIRQRFVEAGGKGVELLLDMIDRSRTAGSASPVGVDGQPQRVVELPGELVVRESTCAPTSN